MTGVLAAGEYEREAKNDKQRQDDFFVAPVVALLPPFTGKKVIIVLVLAEAGKKTALTLLREHDVENILCQL